MTDWEGKFGWPITVGLDWGGKRSSWGSRSLKEKRLEAGSGRRGGEEGRWWWWLGGEKKPGGLNWDRFNMFEEFQPSCGPGRYSPDDREADVSGEATDLEWGAKVFADMADLAGESGS